MRLIIRRRSRLSRWRRLFNLKAAAQLIDSLRYKQQASLVRKKSSKFSYDTPSDRSELNYAFIFEVVVVEQATPTAFGGRARGALMIKHVS